MRKAIGLVALLALAACDRGGDGNGAAGEAPSTGGSGAGSTSGSVALQPGQWEATVQIEAANLPNMPPGMAPPTMQPMTTRFCITPQMAANPSAEAMAGDAQQQQQRASCRTENYSFANGRIQGTMICNTGGVASRTTISGQFTPTSYEQTMQTETEAAGTRQSSTMRVAARRIGDCPAG